MPNPESERRRELVVSAAQAGTRLDRCLADAFPDDLSRTAAHRAIEAGDVLVDERRQPPRYFVKAGQTIVVTLPVPQPSTVEAEAIALDIVYEDSDLLVIDKAAPMVTHPAPGAYGGTLVNALLAHCTDLSGIGGQLRPGIVHRLDKDTTGLLVVAKHDQAHRSLAGQLAVRTMKRTYLALVYGDPAWDETVVEAAIARDPRERTRMAVRADGRAARTTLTVLARYGPAALVQAQLDTGRTHQVRLHCAHLGHPLLGDPTYGPKRARAAELLPPDLLALVAQLPGQALHATRLTFNHPRDGRLLAFDVAPPARFAAVQAALARSHPTAP